MTASLRVTFQVVQPKRGGLGKTRGGKKSRGGWKKYSSSSRGLQKKTYLMKERRKN